MPQFEWLGRLNIVMVIEQYRVGAAATQLAVNRRWRAFGKEPLRLKTSFTEQPFNQVSHLRHTQTLGRYARLPAEQLKRCLSIVCVFIQIYCDQVCHWNYLSTLISNFPGLRVACGNSPILVLSAGFAACGCGSSGFLFSSNNNSSVGCGLCSLRLQSPHPT